MSASNWSNCPRCRHRAAVEAERRIEALRDSYGKVTADEYAVMAKTAVLTPPFTELTFREDYDISGAADGIVNVNYSGNCHICGLSLDFTTMKPIEGITDE